MTDEVNLSNLVARDLRHVWHPCTQMQEHELYPPLPVARAEGSFIYLDDGRPVIDAISSWWCKSLGHRHPMVAAAVKDQMLRFEHVIMAGTVNETLVELSEKLAKLCDPLTRAFYADNGSTGVEVAIKMALQAQQQSGHGQRQGLVSLRNGYHGETLLTMGVSNCDLYSGPFRGMLPDCTRLESIPYRSGPEDLDWDSLNDDEWELLERQLAPLADSLAAIVVEPIVQGAGNMRIYSPALLRELRAWASANQVYLIADEIMTGLGRTGRVLACDHAGIRPDFAVLSKALTAGWLPMAVVMTSDEIYELFYDDYWSGKAFLHSNTYAGNALATAAAVAALTVYETEGTIARVARDGASLRTRMHQVAERTGALTNVRGVGFVVAADLVNPATGEAFDKTARTGWHVYHEAIRRGAWLRPLGDTMYWLPPLNTEDDVLDQLAELTAQAIVAVV